MKITEIVPDDMPKWANDAFDGGQFFRVCLAKVGKLEKENKKLKKIIKNRKEIE